MKPIIVIPTFNEAQNIEELIRKIFQVLKDTDFKILIVDDSSSDGTVEIVNNLINEYHNLYLLERPSKLGLASAYVEGFKYGIGLGADTFVQMDGDMSHNPEYLKEILKELKDNDVVIASRYVDGGGTLNWGLFRKTVSFLGSFYARKVLDCPIKDLTGGYNAYKIDILNKIGLDNIISEGFCFQIEMKYRCYKKKAHILELPIIFKDRTSGVSKMNKTIFFEAFFNVIKLKILLG